MQMFELKIDLGGAHNPKRDFFGFDIRQGRGAGDWAHFCLGEEIDHSFPIGRCRERYFESGPKIDPAKFPGPPDGSQP